jgi:hypothetical protein
MTKVARTKDTGKYAARADRERVMRPIDCRHKWQPFTQHKAKCSKCKRTAAWSFLLGEAEERISGLTAALVDVAKVALKYRKKAETDGAAAIAYMHGAHAHLDRMLAVLVEAGVVSP